MKIYLARHGQSNYNVLGLCNADPAKNVHLTEKGLQQARVLAEKLKNISIEHIFVSELRRTKQTADIINKFHNLPIQVDSRLNDNRSGYEGRPASNYYSALERAGNKWIVSFNDGESLIDVKNRVKSFIDELRVQEYQSVLVITSKVIVQFFCGLLKGLTDEQAWDFQVEKGSCTELELS